MKKSKIAQRTFIVYRDSDFYNAMPKRETSLKLYRYPDVVTLLDAIEVIHIDGTEREILDGVIDCNGDGDDYIMIAEVNEHGLRILVK